jgi:hypothetical protein
MFVSETKPNTIQTISNYSCLSICGPLHTFTSTRFHITCLQNQNGIGRKKYRFVHRPFCTNQVPLDILRFVQDRVVIRHKIKGFTVGQLKILGLPKFSWVIPLKTFDFVQDRVVIRHKMNISLRLQFCEESGMHKSLIDQLFFQLLYHLFPPHHPCLMPGNGRPKAEGT